MYEAEKSDEQAQTRGFNRTSFAADGYNSRKTKRKPRSNLFDELLRLRERIKDLEAFEDAEQKAIATELKGTRQRLQYLLAVSPAIIYTTKASGDYACTFVSENLRAIMGYTPVEMTTRPEGLAPTISILTMPRELTAK